MMFAEGSDEIRTENRRGLCSISVREPVHNTGDQIRLDIAGHDGHCQHNPSVRTVQSRGQFPTKPDRQAGESGNRRKFCYAMES